MMSATGVGKNSKLLTLLAFFLIAVYPAAARPKKSSEEQRYGSWGSFSGIGGSLGGSVSGSLGGNFGIGFSNGGASGNEYGLNLFGSHSASAAANGHFNLGTYSGGYHHPPRFGFPGQGQPGFGYSGNGFPNQGSPGFGNPNSGAPGFGTPNSGGPGFGNPGQRSPSPSNPNSGAPGFGEPAPEATVPKKDVPQQSRESSREILDQGRETQNPSSASGSRESIEPQDPGQEFGDTEDQRGGAGIISPRAEVKQEKRKRWRFLEKLRNYLG